MIVSHERRVLFVHVQKTGGVTVEKFLLAQLPGAEKLSGLPGRRHARRGVAVRRQPEIVDYFTFGFVRNPWARMWSWYSMIQQREQTAAGGDDKVGLRIERNRFWSGVLAELPTFEAFVLDGPDRFRRLTVPQVGFLDLPGRPADFIGRTETLDADLASVCERLAIPVPPVVPRRNVGGGGGYQQHFTPAMRSRVATIYAEDIERFGYRFDQP